MHLSRATMECLGFNRTHTKETIALSWIRRCIAHGRMNENTRLGITWCGRARIEIDDSKRRFVVQRSRMGMHYWEAMPRTGGVLLPIRDVIDKLCPMPVDHQEAFFIGFLCEDRLPADALKMIHEYAGRGTLEEDVCGRGAFVL